jgi:xanthine dehydrogenase accessory factor
MKQWNETMQVLRALDAIRGTTRRAALATVVRTSGSAYRHEGAKMLVCDDETSIGNVSGGCLEADVREVAQRVIASGVSELRTYRGGSDEVAAWDLGIGCDGEVEILIARADFECAQELSAIAEQVRYVAITRVDRAGTAIDPGRMIVTQHVTAGSLGDEEVDASILTAARASWVDQNASRIETVNGVRVFIDAVWPPPQLIIASASDDARVLARMALEVGFRVVVVDRRKALLTRDRFPFGIDLVVSDAEHVHEAMRIEGGAYAVMMTHSFADDLAYLRAMLRTNVRYIGMLGPRARTERMLVQLEGEAPLDRDRVYGPVGLDIGTDGAEQVALAILAEILAVESGRQPHSLRDRRVAIHQMDA